MKICAVICEYNPFHNGHKYLLDQIRSSGRFDKILCIMSGCFTQRGEIAVMDPYTRAIHAVKGGADAVIELPTVFATATAEQFSEGALSILSKIPEVSALAFGTENGTIESLTDTAKMLLNESEEVSQSLKDFLKEGYGFAKARELAYDKNGYDTTLLKNANDILAVEYTKAILKHQYPIGLFPVRRIGQSYSDQTKTESYASATSIRANAEDDAYLKSNVPSYVYDDLTHNTKNDFETAILTALNLSTEDELREIHGVLEGLEKALKKDYISYNELIDSVSGKRYPKARIRRIVLHNLLSIKADTISLALNNPLYISPLHVEDDMLKTVLGNATIPMITKGRDILSLSNVAKMIFEIDLRSEHLFEVCKHQKISKKIFEKVR